MHVSAERHTYTDINRKVMKHVTWKTLINECLGMSVKEMLCCDWVHRARGPAGVYFAQDHLAFDTSIASQLTLMV
jgi:hypothetical protein